MTRSRRIATATALGVLVVAGIVAANRRGHDGSDTLARSLRGPDRLVTNEYALRHPADPRAVSSPEWIATSGSLFVRGGVGYSGSPTRGHVDPQSARETNSGVLRVVSRRAMPPDIAVRLRLRVLSMVPPSSPFALPWDGVHVFVRYVSETELYVVSVGRRDDEIAIKRKLPGGSSNGGHYRTLASARRPLTARVWHAVDVRTFDVPDGVRIVLFIDGAPALAATDSGQGGPAIRSGGRIGVRGDNAEFEFSDVDVHGCASAALNACGS